MQCACFVPHLRHSTLFVRCFHIVLHGVVHRLPLSYRIPLQDAPPCAGLVCGGSRWDSFRVGLWGIVLIWTLFVHVFGERTGAHCSWVCTWRGILGCESLQNKCLSLGNTTGVSAYIIATSRVEELSSSTSAQMLRMSASLSLTHSRKERRWHKSFGLVCISPMKNYIENLLKCT